MRDHGFTFTSNNTPESALKCQDCSYSFITKPELMQHKTEKHYKTRLCPFYHGTGRGCSFPSTVCFNIHEESITPTNKESIDFRKRIPCRNGNNCFFNQRQKCFYAHVASNVETHSPPQVESRSIQNYTNQGQLCNQKEKCMKCNGEFNCKADLDHHMRTSHRGGEVNSETYAAIVKIGQQMENVSQRLQMLELKSMGDFPTVAGGHRKV